LDIIRFRRSGRAVFCINTLILLTDNLFSDDILESLVSSGILVENLKEIIPALAHRLLILTRLNKTFSTEPQSTTTVPESEFQHVTMEEVQLVDGPESQVKCTDCALMLERNWSSIWDHLRYSHLLTQTKIFWIILYYLNSIFSTFLLYRHHVQTVQYKI
jgi:hypothetical protein